MFRPIFNACKKVINVVKEQIKKLLKPAPVVIAAGALADLPRTKTDLIVENAILRQQVIVLKRTVKRPKLTPGDRIRLLFLSRLSRFLGFSPAHRPAGYALEVASVPVQALLAQNDGPK